MSGKFKKSFAAVLASALCVSASVGAAEWRIKDYDTSAGITPAPIVYQEFDANGLPTGRVVAGYEAQQEGLKGFAQVELKNSWVSDVYPNAEYINLYADGNYTGRVYPTGRDGKDLVTYRDVDFMWEAAAPYRIYSIKQAKLFKDGKVQWFGNAEMNYPVEYTNRNADVKVERIKYGFGEYEITGTNAVAPIPEKIVNEGYFDMNAYTRIKGVTADMIKAKEEAPKAVEISKNTDIEIPRTYDLKLTGPSFDQNGKATANGLTLIASKDSDYAKYNVKNILETYNDSYGYNEMANCEITWTPAGYEAAKPYRLYEYLTVDGVVMDGSIFYQDCEKTLYKPCIYAYSGATANLKHRTVVAGVNDEGEVVLQTQVSYNDGKTYVNEGAVFGTGIYPNVEYRIDKGLVDGEKTVTPVYVFEYCGKMYDTYEVNGEWIVELWGNNLVSTDSANQFLEPYVK